MTIDNKLDAILSAGRAAFKSQFAHDPNADTVSSGYIFAEISNHSLKPWDETSVEGIAEALWQTKSKIQASAAAAAALSARHGYWNSHPDYPLEDWRNEIASNDTRNGYWEWVASCIERDSTN